MLFRIFNEFIDDQVRMSGEIFHIILIYRHICGGTVTPKPN